MITHAQFEELKRLAEAAGPPTQGLQIQLDSRKLRARGQYLMALEKHGAELIETARVGAAARIIVTEILKLVPLEDVDAAGQTGVTLVEWLRTKLAELESMKARADDRRDN